MSNQFPAFHALTVNGSRMTSLPEVASWAKVRLLPAQGRQLREDWREPLPAFRLGCSPPATPRRKRYSPRARGGRRRELEIHESYHTLIRSVTSTQPRLSGDWHALLPLQSTVPPEGDSGMTKPRDNTSTLTHPLHSFRRRSSRPIAPLTTPLSKLGVRGSRCRGPAACYAKGAIAGRVSLLAIWKIPRSRPWRKDGCAGGSRGRAGHFQWDGRGMVAVLAACRRAMRSSPCSTSTAGRSSCSSRCCRDAGSRCDLFPIATSRHADRYFSRKTRMIFWNTHQSDAALRRFGRAVRTGTKAQGMRGGGTIRLPSGAAEAAGVGSRHGDSFGDEIPWGHSDLDRRRAGWIEK